MCPIGHRHSKHRMCDLAGSNSVMLCSPLHSQAWANVMGGDQQYQEFAERWGSEGFSAYANLLRAQADRALQNASEASSRSDMQRW
jgi:hypothetical protein